jgi:hypothetical protein
MDHTAASPRPRPRIRLNRVVFILLIAVLVVVVVKLAVPRVQLILATTRSAPAYNPPVLAGQLLWGCTGGFYARQGDRVVIAYSAHCANPNGTVTLPDGRVLGQSGAAANIVPCPAGRVCESSDFMPVYLDPANIPWGHLNLVDFTGGGYRTITAGSPPLACGDIQVGDSVELGGRNLYRTGKVVASGRYEFTQDVIFPCMLVTDIEVGVGDSGGPVLDNGRPAGITAREIDGFLGFTPLAEGLSTLGLTLCTDPDCGLTPPARLGAGG